MAKQGKKLQWPLWIKTYSLKIWNSTGNTLPLTEIKSDSQIS